MTVAIVLPSGVDRNFTVRVSPDGHNLLLSVTWPSPIVDLKMLHRKWISSNGDDHLEMYHPKFIDFEHFFKKFRVVNIDTIESTAVIKLLFQVQTHISDKFSLWWDDSSSKVIYVELRGQVNWYNFNSRNEDFEVC